MAGAGNEAWIYVAHPSGAPTEDGTFRREPCAEERPEAGKEVLVKPLFFSVDPYLRGRMAPSNPYLGAYRPGEPMDSLFVGEVLESLDEGFKPGDTVTCNVGFHGPWKRRFAIAPAALTKIDPAASPVPMEAHLGVLGMPGMTAFFSCKELGQPKAGETVFVSGAAGAVGTIVGQLFKRAGCRVVGSAGSDAKVALLREKFGYDAAWNYKTIDTAAALREHAPGGIDIYFDNVGGETLDAALLAMKPLGRIVACGSISQYNSASPEARYGVKNLFMVVVRQLRMEGFLVGRWRARFPEAVAELSALLAAGELKSEETVVEGFEALPRAMLALFSGGNVGKLVVRV